MGTALIILGEMLIWGLVLLGIGASIEWIFSKIRRRRIDNLLD
jgi:hypothetical protein